MNVIEVVDVPHGTSEDDARTLLNMPCESSRYMLVQVLPLPGGGTRAFYRLVNRAYDQKPGERAELHGWFKANRDGMDDAARTLIKYNMGRSVRALVKLLEGRGIKRGKSWVSDMRLELRGGVTEHE